MPSELRQALNKALEPSTDLQDPKKCKHKRKAGDNFGVSCLDCGSVLEGYGYIAKRSKTCIHKYVLTENISKICIYCEDLSSNTL